ncbi:MAG: glycoside hydrolase family 2 TIM barrel-domain containing protein [Roseburia sp.]
MSLPRHYENLHILHENTMPNRSYYIPSSTDNHVFVTDRVKSDRFQLLNGEWNFRYYESVYDLTEPFYEKDFNAGEFGKITVPGVWQNAGYGRNQYTNIHYPFPFDPPYVPQNNPCGAYVYDFEYQKEESAPRTYLIFEGVDSCFYVWLNGSYVGYSQVSHSTSEFDVSHLMVEGANRIAVLVLKWCDGSYMEDQDKFRMSGIFNDVYLLKRPDEFIFDYFIKTGCAETETEAMVTADISYRNHAVPTKVKLFDMSGNLIGVQQISDKEQKAAQTHLEFMVRSPRLWSAETPYLYIISFETAKEVITDRVGIREISIKDCVVHFNGKPVVFRGVNRHDFDPVTGFTISAERMRRDLALMKQHNFNAIRCSHYPNAPYFYQLCDEYGFYVVDEADNESHGVSEIYYADDDFENKSKRWNEAISDNPEFVEATVDRVQRMVMREKNRACVVVWSMGNECAYGCTFERALKWTKEYDSSRLTHFESARYHSDKKKYDFSNLNLFGRMYPSLAEIEEYLRNEPDKPMILIEYCHSMGNGPGDLEDYFKLIYREKLMCGGFVWEWCDHAIYKGRAENGKGIYHYGGDHGEDVHDGNFCVDGLVYPNGTPHTGLLEYKNVHRPIRVESFRQDAMEADLKNYLDFLDAKDHVRIRYEVSADGRVREQGCIPAPSIRPGEIVTIKLPARVPDAGKAFLKLLYETTAGDTALLPRGHIFGFDELELDTGNNQNQKVKSVNEGFGRANKKLTVQEDDISVQITGDTFFYQLDKRTGLFDRMTADGGRLMEKPMEINIWRAPTDNDMYIKKEWYRAKYNKTSARAYKVWTEMVSRTVEIHCEMSLAANAVQRILDMNTIWTIDGNGTIALSMKVVRNLEFPMLPRFGIRLFLPAEMNRAEYFGMGPMESYCDKHRAAAHGVFASHVRELHEDYIRPQENGSHFDCSYVTVSGGGDALTVVADKAFCFNLSEYTQEELECKKHNYELEASGSTIFCIDYAQNGIGSNSCGPDLLDQYSFKDETFEFAVKLSWAENKI